MRGEVGPTLLQRFCVTVDPDELDGWEGLQDAEGVTRPPERSVDDGSAMLQCRTKEFDDFCCEDWFVSHMGYRPRARVARLTIATKPPIDEPVRAKSTRLWPISRATPARGCSL